MKLKTIAISALVTTLGLMAPVMAQRIQIRYNTDDPALFLSGEANSCQGCDLNGITLSPDPDVSDRYAGLQMRQANLRNATLSDLDLSGSYFTCADLSGADLSGANLSNVDFLYTNLSGANLSGANLSAATFRGAIVDEETNLDGITIDRNTIAPNSQFAQQTGPMASVTPIPFDNRPYCLGRSQ